MDHRSALATFRNLALRAGSATRRAAGRAATIVTREVSPRTGQRAARSTVSVGTPPGHAPPEGGPGSPDRSGAPAEPVARPTTPTPADVARAVARNAADLPRTNPGPQPRQASHRPAPGAKLPARAGRGILRA